MLALVGKSPRVAPTLELACLLARQRAARLQFVYILQVPRSLALEAPFEEGEAAAARALGAAQQMAEQYELPAGPPPIGRARRSAPRWARPKPTVRI